MIDRIVSAFCWAFLVIAITIAITFGVDKLDEVVATRRFNNGVCTECGGNYIFVQAVGHQITTDYIYECDMCGKHIEIPKYK